VKKENLTMTKRLVEVAGGEGAAIQVNDGEYIRIVNTHGTQVVDFWAHRQNDPKEHLGLSQCREVLQKIYFTEGDTLLTNRYKPCLTIVRDDSGISHDTLIAPCSDSMYRFAGAADGHRSCADNYRAAYPSFPAEDPPQPWNLFMTASIGPKGEISYSRPPLRPGMTIELRADMAMTIVVSSCPDDFYPTNGGDGSPQPVHLEIDSNLQIIH
jgi:uncharacterized protein YcgI (DUF1989 family)